jgi:hypothetical protein
MSKKKKKKLDPYAQLTVELSRDQCGSIYSILEWSLRHRLSQERQSMPYRISREAELQLVGNIQKKLLKAADKSLRTQQPEKLRLERVEFELVYRELKAARLPLVDLFVPKTLRA